MNRIAAIMAHGYRLAFSGPARLAGAVGCAPSTISRLMRGRTSPSPDLMARVAAALGEDLFGQPLPVDEVFSPDGSGSYPTPSTCALSGNCGGCYPDYYFDRRGGLRPAFRGRHPGEWCTYPALADAYPNPQHYDTNP